MNEDLNQLISRLENELAIARKQLEQYVVSKEQAMKFISTGYANGIEMAIAEAKKILNSIPTNLCAGK